MYIHMIYKYTYIYFFEKKLLNLFFELGVRKQLQSFFLDFAFFLFHIWLT